MAGKSERIKAQRNYPQSRTGHWLEHRGLGGLDWATQKESAAGIPSMPAYIAPFGEKVVSDFTFADFPQPES
jgi:hypothetical protein